MWNVKSWNTEGNKKTISGILAIDGPTFFHTMTLVRRSVDYCPFVGWFTRGRFIFGEKETERY